MNDLSKKGLYTLVYTPKKSMNENCYYTHVKIGRTGISFKKRFQGYKGSNKVTNDRTDVLRVTGLKKRKKFLSKKYKVL